MIDYARPTMEAEKALKDVHQSMLSRDYGEAKEAVLYCMLKLGAIFHAIEVEEENVREASTRV